MEIRSLLLNRSTKYVLRKEFYKCRVARIVVDAPKEVAVHISKMENIETQKSTKTQPYVEVLKHGHGQWIAYSCPSKPKVGVPVGHESRRLWDVSSSTLFFICFFLSILMSMSLYILFCFLNAFVMVANITFNHHLFSTREAHMLMYANDIYD